VRALFFWVLRKCDVERSVTRSVAPKLLLGEASLSARSNQGIHVKRSRALFSAVCAVLVLTGCGLVDSPKRDRAALEAALKNGNHRVAIELARKLITNHPEDPSYRLMLAKALGQAGDFDGAIAQATQARDAGLAPSVVGGVLAEALLAKGDFRAALKVADSREQYSANTAAMGRVRGFAHLGLGQPAEARREFASVLEAEPGDLRTLLALASAVEYEEGPTAAAATLRRASAQFPENQLLRLALADAQSRASDPAASATYAAVERAAREQKDDALLAASIYASGSAALSKRDLVTAKARRDELTSLAAAADSAQLLSARISLAERRAQDAVDQLQILLARNAKDVDARLVLVAALSELGSVDGVQRELETILRQQPAEARARRLMAELLVAQNKAQEALKFVPAADAAADSATLQVGGRARLLLGDWQSAAAYFRENLERAPRDERSRVELAASYLAGGRHDDALAALAGGPSGGAQSIGAKLVRLQALGGKGDKTAALGIAEDLANRANDDRSLLAAAYGYVVLEEKTRARGVLDALSKRSGPRSSITWLAIADLEMGVGRSDRSAAAADKAVQADATDLSTLMLAAKLARARGANDSAYKLYERAASVSKAALEPRLELARLSIARGDYETANKHVADLRAVAPNSSDVARLASLIAMRTGDPKLATAILEPIAKASPASAVAQADLALALLAQRRLDDAARAVDAALVADAQSLRGLSAGVMVSLARGRTDEAEVRLNNLQQLSNVPSDLLADLQGEVSAATGDFAAAAKAFAGGYAARPTADFATKEFRARLAARSADPAEPLRRWLARDPNDGTVQALLGQHLESMGNLGEAAAAYQRAIDTGGGGIVALNNLAWIRLTQGRFDEALRLARGAYELDSKSAQVGDTYGWALIASGKAQDAVPILTQAHASVPLDMSIRYRLAVALARTGRTTDALAHLVAVTSSSQRFTELADARKLLAELRGNDPS
jgi:cellulose synthase operon protein C